jgi:hypothetical protein
VEVTLVELKDIQLPDSMKRAMARQAEAEREKRAKIINAEGESMAAGALGDASDTMMAYPLALQLRNLQTLWWHCATASSAPCPPLPPPPPVPASSRTNATQPVAKARLPAPAGRRAPSGASR